MLIFIYCAAIAYAAIIRPAILPLSPPPRHWHYAAISRRADSCRLIFAAFAL